MKQINLTDDAISAVNKYVCNSSTIQSFEGEEHEFYNPQLHQPDTVQVVLYGYIMPILAFIRYVSNETFKIVVSILSPKSLWLIQLIIF